MVLVKDTLKRFTAKKLRDHNPLVSNDEFMNRMFEVMNWVDFQLITSRLRGKNSCTISVFKAIHYLDDKELNHSFFEIVRDHILDYLKERHFGVTTELPDFSRELKSNIRVTWVNEFAKD